MVLCVYMHGCVNWELILKIALNSANPDVLLERQFLQDFLLL